MRNLDLKFGTSGLRGLASDLTGRPAFTYSLAFARLLLGRGLVGPKGKILIGRDLRASSPEIAEICAAGIEAAGLAPVDCGALPTSALACFGLAEKHPAIMVTGSHIPGDRNGLKFYRSDGEIDKADEKEIVALEAAIPEDVAWNQKVEVEIERGALERYIARLLNFFPARSLAGMRIGVYQHSSVARDLLVTLLGELGAETRALGRSETFVAVDTEALRQDDQKAARSWAREFRLSAIVSTDGDADRPLIADGEGQFLRGDLVGAATAYALGADCVVTPITSNSGLELSGKFERVRRTRIGSPYVIEGMQQAITSGAKCVVGFEANGGVLLGTAVEVDGRKLSALPTRDALLPILCLLMSANSSGQPLELLGEEFSFRAAVADRLEHVPTEISSAFLARLSQNVDFRRDLLGPRYAGPGIDRLDGVRMTGADGSIVHFRASGNAPELRCYVEDMTEPDAKALLEMALKKTRAYLTAQVT
jgi:phosphomannomutase